MKQWQDDRDWVDGLYIYCDGEMTKIQLGSCLGGHDINLSTPYLYPFSPPAPTIKTVWSSSKPLFSFSKNQRNWLSLLVIQGIVFIWKLKKALRTYTFFGIRIDLGKVFGLSPDSQRHLWAKKKKIIKKLWISEILCSLIAYVIKKASSVNLV